MDRFSLGIDLGTSSLKVLLLSSLGKVKFSYSHNYPTKFSRPNYSEQDPDDWYKALVDSIKVLFDDTGISNKQIEGLSITGQMHGLVCVDSNGQKLRNAIIWSDRRSTNQVENIIKRIGKFDYIKSTGNPISTGFLFPTYLWIRENEKEVFDNTFCLLMPKDYLCLKLTDSYFTDYTDASASGLFDVDKCSWNECLINIFNISDNILPIIKQTSSEIGKVSQNSARETGLLEGTPVFMGGGDTPVQALSQGLLQEGKFIIGLSSGANIISLSKPPKIDSAGRVHCFRYVIPEFWYNMAATLSAGNSLLWLQNNLSPKLSISEMISVAEKVSNTEELFFLPHLNGERTPYMDPTSKGGFFGLTSHHDLSHMIRSILEGVSFSLKSGFDILCELGNKPETIIVSGGGSRSRFWVQILSDILNYPIEISENHFGASMGAAIIAGIGVGFYSDYSNACELVLVKPRDIITPNEDNVNKYHETYKTFMNLYPMMKSLYG